MVGPEFEIQSFGSRAHSLSILLALAREKQISKENEGHRGTWCW